MKLTRFAVRCHCSRLHDRLAYRTSLKCAPRVHRSANETGMPLVRPTRSDREELLICCVRHGSSQHMLFSRTLLRATKQWTCLSKVLKLHEMVGRRA